ncbi:MAG: response regulator transcription factor [Bacteroidales bacterium]|nr:response regulator transcription factor [Bacteroidales bacterium]
MIPKTLVIVDDHALFRGGLKMILALDFTGIEILEAVNGKDFLDMLPEIEPDIVLMDINMPEMDGAEATRLAMQLKPGLRIIALSMFGDELYYYKMIDAGVMGFVLKDSEIAEVKEAIKTVMEGGNYFSRELLYKVVKSFKVAAISDKKNLDITGREMEILQLICKGFSNQEISEKLFISKRTVDKHRANVLFKTNSRNTAHLVMNAISNHWIKI